MLHFPKGSITGHTVDGRNPANQLGCKKHCKYWGKLPINWCRISSINSINVQILQICPLPHLHPWAKALQSHNTTCNSSHCHYTPARFNTRSASSRFFRQQNTFMNHHTQPFPQANKNETGKKNRKHQLKNGTKPSPFQKKPSISIAHQNLHLPFFFCAKFQRMDSCRLCKCDWWISLRRCLEVNNLMVFLLSVE